jgi:hypothetical protein
MLASLWSVVPSLKMAVRFFIFCVVPGFLGLSLFAAPLVSETPVGAYGTPTTVSISTSTWTEVPASSSLNGRSGVLVSVPATNTANMVGHLGDCSSTSIATTVRPLEFVKGNGYALVPIDDSVCLWLLSLHTAAENAHVQEVRQ